MKKGNNLVACGCINPIACDVCKGTGLVRSEDSDLLLSADDVQINVPGVANLAPMEEKKTAYF
jgi:hypothetical protein